MNKIPNILSFLNVFDPKKSIDREKLMADVTNIAILQSIAKTKEKVKQETRKRLDEVLNARGFTLDDVLKVLSNPDDKNTFYSCLNESIEEVKKDYIKTHLEALSEEKRNQVLEKLPSLATL